MIFDKGDAVAWSSGAGGYDKEKRGIYLVRLPPYTDYRPFLDPDTPRSHIKTDMPRSSIDRALVEVVQANGSRHYYTPRYSLLKKIDTSD